MLLAEIENGIRTEAKPKLKAICPACRSKVVPKCGKINIWHFAHDSNSICEGKPETQWHLSWKKKFPLECVEITKGNHRADVIYRGCVFEFESRRLEPDKILERQKFWLAQGNAFRWVFKSDREQSEALRETRNSAIFRFLHPWKRALPAHTPFYIDFPDMLLLVTSYWEHDGAVFLKTGQIDKPLIELL